MHVTSRVHKNIRYLRSRRVVRKIAALAAGAAERGMTILLSQTMDSHIHLVVQVESRKALHDGTRYFFGQLARYLNKLNGRSDGQVFTDRFASRVMRTTIDTWNVFGYVVRNPRAAGLPVPYRGFDGGLLIATQAILNDRFLKRFFGTDPDRFLAVLTRMKLEPVPYQSLWRDPHPQLALPLG